MNIRKIFAGLLLTLAVSSCIQDEALNVEAAIDDCTGENIQLASIDATHKEIEIYVLDGTDVSQQELNFTLADGATIQADETEAGDQPPYYDFSQRTLRRFTVTSEDGNTTATYVVRINKMELPTHHAVGKRKPRLRTERHGTRRDAIPYRTGSNRPQRQMRTSYYT